MKTHRPDIDALRAIAVIAVVLFHLKLSIVPGGFAGVDVFFAISGYLISGQIIERAEANRFSFIEFYGRRIRRLFPALFCTVALSFALGALLLPPDEFKLLARDTIASLLGYSNFNFWLDAHNYFAPSSNSLVLLHIWSLSLEEQFYLLWPALLLLVIRLAPPKALPMAIGAILFASLLISEIWLSIDPSAAFYLLPFRVFEFCIGALAIFAERKIALPKIALELTFCIGLTLIIGSILIFDMRDPFPGIRALLPCIGAALVLYSGATSKCAAAVSARPIRWMGLISYSVYLCHWPITTFYFSIAQRDGTGPIAVTALFIGIVASGALMHRYVENNFRAHEPLKTIAVIKSVAYAAAAIVLLLVPARSAIIGNGWEWRLSREKHEAHELLRFGGAPCIPKEPGVCVFGYSEEPTAVYAMGDSYVQQIIGVVDTIAREKHMHGRAMYRGGCSGLIGLARIANGKPIVECIALRDNLLSEIRNSGVPVIIAQAWQGYDDLLSYDDGRLIPTTNTANRVALWKAAIESTLSYLGPAIPVLIVGQQVLNACDINRHVFKPGPLTKIHGDCPPVSISKARETTAPIDSMLKEIAKHYSNVSLLLPIDYLCQSDCPVNLNGIYLYQDEGHLTVAGTRYFQSRARQDIERFLNNYRRTRAE